ncbi:MAG TPA: outer membrane protein assembly factor BamA [Elusimicrobiota bacterium]|nr:outer membrane protein assembly factor BamA [Elusimicrobiota bacterium]
MRRVLFLFCLLSCLTSGTLLRGFEKRQVIKELTVKGVHNVKPRQVLSHVKARKGDVVVDPTFRADVDRILETGLFDEVQVDIEELENQTDAAGLPKVRIIFQVKERPLIRRIDFKGNTKVSAGKFRDELSSKVDDSLDKFKVAQDEQKILSVYREEGYADAKVESYTSVNPKNKKVILTFFITEGNRILVQEVTMAGNSVYSSKKLKKILKLRRKKVFKEETLRTDLDELQKFYKNRGYLEVEIPEPSRKLNEDRTKITLDFTVDEGHRYSVGDFSFEGATLFTDKELNKAISLKKGTLYNQDRFDESLQKLRDMYADKGYLRAEIEPERKTRLRSETLGDVDFHFVITESSVVYVDRIYVDGNTYTKEQVIRREILLQEGDVFSAGKVRRSVEKIYNLGFLDDVQVDVQQPRSPTQADIVFSVVEGHPGMLSAGAGFSSVDGLLGTFQIQHINLFGRAQRVNAMVEFGERKQNYEIGWTDPWFLGKRMSFGVDFFDTRRQRPFGTDSYAYTERRRGSSLRLGPRLTDRLSLAHTYSYEEIRVYDIDPSHVGNADPTLNITPSQDITSSITNAIIYDSRDNIFDATRGCRQSASVQLAGGPIGGNIHFYKPQVSSAVYLPTFWKFVLTVSGRIGWARHYAPSKDVPLSERFVVGGVDTVRGYDYGEIGPADYGRVMGVFNAEYKFPIVQERNKTILQGAFFADAGGSWSRTKNVDLRIGSQPNQMRSGVGFGIRFTTPVFPIRLDWGYGLNHKPGEQISQFYFTIGSIF